MSFGAEKSGIAEQWVGSEVGGRFSLFPRECDSWRETLVQVVDGHVKLKCTRVSHVC